jgi:hypothetical protein
MKYYQPIKHRHSAQFKTDRSTYQFESLASEKIRPISKLQMQKDVERVKSFYFVQQALSQGYCPPQHNVNWLYNFITSIEKWFDKGNQKLTDKQSMIIEKVKTDIETYKLILKKNTHAN